MKRRDLLKLFTSVPFVRHLPVPASVPVQVPPLPPVEQIQQQVQNYAASHYGYQTCVVFGGPPTFSDQELQELCEFLRHNKIRPRSDDV